MTDLPLGWHRWSKVLSLGMEPYVIIPYAIHPFPADRSNTGVHAGKRRQSGLDDVTDWTGMALPELVTLAMERKAYRQFVHMVVQAPHGV